MEKFKKGKVITSENTKKLKLITFWILKTKSCHICCASIVHIKVAVTSSSCWKCRFILWERWKNNPFNYLRECLLNGINETYPEIRHRPFRFDFEIIFFPLDTWVLICGEEGYKYRECQFRYRFIGKYSEIF